MNGDLKKNNKNEVVRQNDEELSNTEQKDGLEDSDIFEGMPPAVEKTVNTMLSMQGFSGSVSSALESKLNEKHIDKILDMREKRDERKFKDTNRNRIFSLIFILILTAIFIFLTLFLVDKNTDLFKEIIKLFIVFVGGVGAGYGFKTYKDRD